MATVQKYTIMKKIALDLFCGVGGAAYGLLWAGFDEVIGIDIRKPTSYPGTFIQADIHDLPVDVHDFDFVWASPPCQLWTTGNHRWKTKVDHPNLIPITRKLLAGHPFTCIENVPQAPIRDDLTLWGPQVGLGPGKELDGIWRKRIFELSFLAWQMSPPVMERGRYISICGSFGASHHFYRRKAEGKPGSINKRHAMALMGLPMCLKANRQEVANAVPPLYAKYIAEQAIQQM